eukprot:4224365-Alexandrium_andersonii.AAC.1
MAKEGKHGTLEPTQALGRRGLALAMAPRPRSTHACVCEPVPSVCQGTRSGPAPDSLKLVIM